MMRFSVMLLLAACLQVSARGFGQQVTLSERNARMEDVFRKIRLQTGYTFTYTASLLDHAGPVTVDIRNGRLEQVLDLCFKDQPFAYTIIEKTIAVRLKNELKQDEKKPVNLPPPPIEVKGRIVNEAGEPVAASVIVKGTKTGTTTNADGSFELKEVDGDAILVITGVSIEPYEVRVSNRTFINVRVKQKVSDLDEAVVVAYGTTTQRSNTGAVTVVKGEQIQSLPNMSFDRSLQGLVPGLQVTKGTGQPGAGVSNMVLRGIATGTDASFGSTVRNPLFVIDGIPVSQDIFQIATSDGSVTNPLAQLNPSDIESISVLKDAAAIALYGSKASNGVILVTTKRGKPGKMVVGFRHQTNVSTKLLGKVEMLNQEEYMKLVYDTYKNTNPTQWTDQAILADLKSKFPVRADGSFYPAPDLFDELYSNAVGSTNEISISGGNDRSNFYLNLENTNNKGAVDKTGYDRKSMRFNFENKPASWFKLGFNTTFSYNKQLLGNGSESGILMYSPLLPIWLENGDYQLIYTQGFSSEEANPVAAAEYNYNGNTSYRGLGKISAEARFLKYFTFASNLGMDYMLAESKSKTDPRFAIILKPTISEQSVRRTALINTNTLSFNKMIGTKHALGVILAQEAQVNTEKKTFISATGTAAALPYYDQVNSPGYTIASSTIANTKQTLLSYFGQLNYNYANRYFLTSGLRRDASSKFGDQQQWGTYWSAGAGWVVTGESFMQGVKSLLNYLKLRGSLGVAGNSGAISNITRFDLLSTVKYLNQNGVVTSVSIKGNPDIRWERTFNWDAGIETRFLHERLSINADIYSRRTNDLVYVTNLPSIAGHPTALSNIGNINNKGIEISASGTIIKGKVFSWIMSANWSSNQNILVKANVPLATISGGLLANEEGRNFNSFYMPVWAGVNPDNGKPQWLDKDGKPTSTYSQAKKEFVGKPQPDGFGGITQSFSYKGLDLTAQFYYTYGTTIYDASMSTLVNDGLIPYINQSKGALDYWKAPGDIAANPARRINNTDRGSSISTRFLMKGDYIRLSNLLLGYNFPKGLLAPLHVSRLRVYIQANNLVTFTNFSGPDPDLISVNGSVGMGYPNERTYSIGLNLDFQ